MADTINLGSWMDYYLTVAMAGLEPAPARQIIQPGTEVAWDECCDGMGWVRLLNVQPTPTATKANGMPCGIQWWNIQLAAGVLRCVDVVDDRGVAPTAEQITADGHEFALDASNLLQAIVCDRYTYQVSGVTPVGPQGGCAGSEVQFIVRVPACQCPPPVEP